MALFMPINQSQRSDVFPNTRSNIEGIVEQNEEMNMTSQRIIFDNLMNGVYDDTKEVASASRARGKKPAKQRDPGLTRDNHSRLKPHAEDLSKQISSGQRFTWNVGHFFEEVLGKMKKMGYHRAEHMVQDMFRPPRTPTGTTPEEDQYLEEYVKEYPGKTLDWRRYRDIRARILIGCALVYEHNLRGYYLNSADKLHATCRPTFESKFRYVNFGISQAQIVTKGTDVSTSSWVFTWMKKHYLPDTETWRKDFEVLVKQCGIEIDETFLPAYQRRELYSRFVQWMYAREPRIPNHLFFAIQASEVYNDPYDREATFKHCLGSSYPQSHLPQGPKTILVHNGS